MNMIVQPIRFKRNRPMTSLSALGMSRSNLTLELSRRNDEQPFAESVHFNEVPEMDLHVTNNDDRISDDALFDLNEPIIVDVKSISKEDSREVFEITLRHGKKIICCMSEVDDEQAQLDAAYYKECLEMLSNGTFPSSLVAPYVLSGDTSTRLIESLAKHINLNATKTGTEDDLERSTLSCGDSSTNDSDMRKLFTFWMPYDSDGERFMSFFGIRRDDSKKRQLKAAAVYLHGIAEQLRDLHSRGIIHCDLKHANVFLRKTSDPNVPEIVLGNHGDLLRIPAGTKTVSSGRFRGTSENKSKAYIDAYATFRRCSAEKMKGVCDAIYGSATDEEINALIQSHDQLIHPMIDTTLDIYSFAILIIDVLRECLDRKPNSSDAMEYEFVFPFEEKNQTPDKARQAALKLFYTAVGARNDTNQKYAASPKQRDWLSHIIDDIENLLNNLQDADLVTIKLPKLMRLPLQPSPM